MPVYAHRKPNSQHARRGDAADPPENGGGWLKFTCYQRDLIRHVKFEGGGYTLFHDWKQKSDPSKNASYGASANEALYLAFLFPL